MLAGIQATNFEVIDVKVKENEIIWYIDHKKNAQYECPRCHQIHDTAFDTKIITLKDTPFGKMKSIWKVKRARVLCDCLLNPIVEFMPFRSRCHRLTKRFHDYIEEILCSKMFTVADVARLFDLDYGTIYKIDHEVLYRLIQEVKIPDPKNISVDEKSFKKGHSYVTIVTDVDIKQVIWVSEGNKKKSLDQFFEVLGPERCEKIKTVAKDLHEPYALSCAQYIPKAVEIADKFHVIKRLNKAIDDSRKELAVGSKLKVSKRKTINNMQWVLRYKQENMKPSHLESLNVLEKVNDKLYKAYLHKESFFDFFEFTSIEINNAKTFLVKWIVEAYKIGLDSMEEFAGYINRNINILLNIVRFRRTSAISEGINRKISVIKSMAYGYRNIQYFMLKIMQRCGVLGGLYKPASYT